MVYAEIMQLKIYHKAQIDEMVAKINQSEQQIFSLEQKVNNLEQELLSNSIEVYNVPILKENIEHIDLAASIFRTAFDININKTDIDHCFVKKINKGNSSANRIQSTNVLHVKFVSHQMKQRIMKAKREKRERLTTNTFGAKGKPESVYINDCLTYQRRQLLNSTLALKTTKGIKYVWTRNGNIFLRKNEGDNSVRITCISDLYKI